MTLLECALAATLFLSLKLSGWKVSLAESFGLIIFSLFWYPAARTLFLGQYSGVNVVLILAALLLIQQKKDIAAGVLLALSTSKPQMVFLILPFCLVWGVSVRRWKLVASIFAGTVVLAVGSMLFLPAWPVEWLAQVREYPTYTGNIGTVAAIIAGALPSASRVLTGAIYGLLGLWLIWEWYRAWGKDASRFLWTAFLTLVISNFIAFRTATPHYVLFLPILFMAFRDMNERLGRLGRILSWSILAFVFFGLWVIFAVTLSGNAESPVNYVPLPIISLAALGWLRSSDSHPDRKTVAGLDALSNIPAG
jgi:hypothetical protein